MVNCTYRAEHLRLIFLLRWDRCWWFCTWLISLQSAIQGFLDPAPSAPKTLRVRYLFRDRMHYAEIPDLSPVVLPLKGERRPPHD